MTACRCTRSFLKLYNDGTPYAAKTSDFLMCNFLYFLTNSSTPFPCTKKFSNTDGAPLHVNDGTWCEIPKYEARTATKRA